MSGTMRGLWLILAAMACALGGGAARGQELVERFNDFSEDPGWEGVNNRIVASDPPTVTQDFGWSATNFSGGGAGEIGGTIWSSTTPAHYAMVIDPPLSFQTDFSASGRVAVLEGNESVYVGFFNHERQEWRPWSSMVIAFPAAGINYMTGLWNGGAGETMPIPSDGSQHTWAMDYDADVIIPAEWPNPNLQAYLSTWNWEEEPTILARAQATEPSITLAELQARLEEALITGHAIYWLRRGVMLWMIRPDYANCKGMATLTIDGVSKRMFMMAGDRDVPTVLDRFGVFNHQLYHRNTRFYISSLTVNGQAVNLAADPGWEGRNNRLTFAEQDFQRQDFGYSATNHAGDAPGEIGGQFYRTEPKDPIHGFYADNVGELTMDDPISFSGHISFTNGTTDAGMMIGYFNREKKMFVSEDELAGWPPDGFMGILIEGPTRIGYYFSSFCSPSKAVGTRADGPIFLPTGEKHEFSYVYDPQANGGNGTITVTLDGTPYVQNLGPDQRQDPNVFDRFGILNLRLGGKYVTTYFDDLRYTAQRRPGLFRGMFDQMAFTDEVVYSENFEPPLPPAGVRGDWTLY